MNIGIGIGVGAINNNYMVASTYNTYIKDIIMILSKSVVDAIMKRNGYRAVTDKEYCILKENMEFGLLSWNDNDFQFIIDCFIYLA